LSTENAIEPFELNIDLDPVLSIKGLHKKYGKIHAVNNLSFEIKKGNVFGILGPNGSGKTTTLGIILGVLNADKGQFRWFGNKNSKEDRKRIGAILEQPLFYPYLTAEKNLMIVAKIKGVDVQDIDRVLKVVDLYERRKSKFRTFSYGMKQRLAIASALLGSPEILIFDEPTNGLDPTGIAEIRELIIKIAKGGVTIILASHLLDEVQKTCSHVIVLKNGERLFSGRVKEVLSVSDTIEIMTDDPEKLNQVLNKFNKVIEITKDNELFVIKLAEGMTAKGLNSHLIGKGIVLSHLAMRKKSLEQQFLELLTANK
jgi:ABC-2 type transport system ATP-binding protein